MADASILPQPAAESRLILSPHNAAEQVAHPEVYPGLDPSTTGTNTDRLWCNGQGAAAAVLLTGQHSVTQAGTLMPRRYSWASLPSQQP